MLLVTADKVFGLRRNELRIVSHTIPSNRSKPESHCVHGSTMNMLQIGRIELCVSIVRKLISKQVLWPTSLLVIAHLKVLLPWLLAISWALPLLEAASPAGVVLGCIITRPKLYFPARCSVVFPHVRVGWSEARSCTKFVENIVDVRTASKNS